MYEEPDTKWVKFPERGNKRPSSYVPAAEWRKKDQGFGILAGNNHGTKCKTIGTGISRLLTSAVRFKSAVKLKVYSE
ncbi:hypothetical protein YC2023_095367 [Brassica napus]